MTNIRYVSPLPSFAQNSIKICSHIIFIGIRAVLNQKMSIFCKSPHTYIASLLLAGEPELLSLHCVRDSHLSVLPLTDQHKHNQVKHPDEHDYFDKYI